MKIIKKISLLLILILTMQMTFPKVDGILENVINLKSIADSNVIEISTSAEMWAFAKEVNNGNGYNGKTIKLTKDIDLGCSKSKPWIPIGANGTNFLGTFDGNNYAIKNMYISLNNIAVNKYNDHMKGFFSNNNGTIKNAIFENCTIEKTNTSDVNNMTVGIIVGENYGRISNCKTYKCIINITKHGKNDYFKIGGIAGEISATKSVIELCLSETTINCMKINGATGTAYCGGISGFGKGIVLNSENKGKITNKQSITGGILGVLSTGKINYCNNKGEITGEGDTSSDAVGGIVGEIRGNGIIYACGNNANVKGEGNMTSLQMGGIAGHIAPLSDNISLTCNILNCYSIGNITTTYTDSNLSDPFPNTGKNSKIIIKNVYTAGSTAQKGYVGLIAGRVHHATLSLSNVYSSHSKVLGDNATSTGITIKTSAEMKEEAFVKLLNKGSTEFSYDGNKKENNGFPSLNKKLGWKKIDGNWYYITKEGEMKTGRLDLEGYTYYFNTQTAEMTKGWKSINGKWYYFCKVKNEVEGYKEGAMIKGWNKLKYNGNNYWFYFAEDNEKYKNYKEGQMLTGRQLVKYNGKNYYYYFCEKADEPEGYVKGAMIKNMTYKGYTYNSSGANPDKVAPVLNESYSTKKATNQNVTVTIKSNEEIEIVSGTGWQLSTNKLKLTKKYTENLTETIKVKDLSGNTQSKKISITNIDKTKPLLLQASNPTNPTNGTVTTRIYSAHEPIQIVKADGWIFSQDSWTLIKEFTNNCSETVIVKDAVGNTQSIKVDITNIDKTKPDLKVSYNPTTATNGNVKATITANEEIKIVSGNGWEQKDKKTLVKEYANNTSETVKVKDLAGNIQSISVVVDKIDKNGLNLDVDYSIKDITNKDITATVNAKGKQISIVSADGWKLSTDKTKITKVFTKNATETVKVKDLEGNTKSIKVIIDKIDKSKPEITKQYYTTEKITNRNVIAAIRLNEEIKIVNANGWNLSEDKMEITKEFEKNGSEKISIKDLAGNEKTIDVKITNIDKEFSTPKIYYSTKNPINGNVEVTIKANEEIRGITGWELRSDKKTLVKSYEKNTEENITVFDIAGNQANINIEITNITEEGPSITSKVDSLRVKSFYIEGINTNAIIREVLDQLIINANKSKIYNKTDKELNETENMVTGTKIVLDDQKTYTFIVTGDVDGDGISDEKDMLEMNRYRLLKKDILEGVYFEAGDITEDGEIDEQDILEVNRLRLNNLKNKQ